MVSLKKITDDIKQGAITITEHVERIIDNIGDDRDYNAFISLYPEQARKQAKIIEKKMKNGKIPELAGIVTAVKDNIAVDNMRMTCGSKMLENYIAPYNATVVKRLLDAGVIIIGKTNMDEFACGSSGETSYFGPAKNPLNPEYVAGGSSSGSAVAVAANFCDIALGSDTGGSIRCPASFCGIVGIKPSYGLVSRYGLVDMAMSLESPGPMAEDIDSAFKILQIISGVDGKDSVIEFEQFEIDEAGAESEKQGSMKRIYKIGVPDEFFIDIDKRVEKHVRKAINSLESAGHEIVEISMSELKYSVAVYYLLVFSEFSSAMAKYDGLKYGFRGNMDLEGLVESVSFNREISLGREVKRRILLGTYITMKEYRGKWYTKALQARRRIISEYEKAFSMVDVLVGPTMPVLPWRLGEIVDDPLKLYSMDIMTVPANIAGICAATMPCGEVSGFSIGLQFQCNRNNEKTLYSVMKEFEMV